MDVLEERKEGEGKEGREEIRVEKKKSARRGKRVQDKGKEEGGKDLAWTMTWREKGKELV